MCSKCKCSKLTAGFGHISPAVYTGGIVVHFSLYNKLKIWELDLRHIFTLWVFHSVSKYNTHTHYISTYLWLNPHIFVKCLSKVFYDYVVYLYIYMQYYLTVTTNSAYKVHTLIECSLKLCFICINECICWSMYVFVCLHVSLSPPSKSPGGEGRTIRRRR